MSKLRIIVKIYLKSNNLKLLEALHKATLPDDASPPTNFTITHEMRGNEVVFSISYSGFTSPEAVRTAISTSEEILRLCKMVLGTIT